MLRAKTRLQLPTSTYHYPQLPTARKKNVPSSHRPIVQKKSARARTVRADGTVRTPLEEHLVEAALYASSQGETEVHFTVSTEHKVLFEKLVERVLPIYQDEYSINYNVSFSEQKPSTDTVAANADNTPFRTDDGKLLFRPGGHGALIQNLNDLQSDVVFVKNIDNVVPDRLKDDTVRYKKLLAGILVTLQKQAYSYRRNDRRLLQTKSHQRLHPRRRLPLHSS